jgi:hypothetical protein
MPAEGSRIRAPIPRSGHLASDPERPDPGPPQPPRPHPLEPPPVPPAPPAPAPPPGPAPPAPPPEPQPGPPAPPEPRPQPRPLPPPEPQPEPVPVPRPGPPPEPLRSGSRAGPSTTSAVVPFSGRRDPAGIPRCSRRSPRLREGEPQARCDVGRRVVSRHYLASVLADGDGHLLKQVRDRPHSRRLVRAGAGLATEQAAAVARKSRYQAADRHYQDRDRALVHR